MLVMQWTGTFTQFVLELERKINDYNQVAEDDERYDDAKKKDSLKQAILGCPDLISLEMFENLHLQKHGKTLDHKMDVCVDSDFLGLHGKEDRAEPDNVRSRTGYVILAFGARTCSPPSQPLL